MANVEYVQTNVNLTIEDARALDLMAAEMGIDNRSAFVRWLVRQEFARRYSRPNQVSVGEALAAGKEVAE